VEFIDFVLQELPPAPARVLEIGCGDRGGVVPALVEAGYEALGVDPQAPAGERYLRQDFREIDGSFDAVVAGRMLHHVDPIEPAAGHIATLAPLVLVNEFAWDLIDESLQRWYDAQPEKTGPPSVDEWRRRHPGLHPHGVVLAALRAHFVERTLEWVPYLQNWLGDVESPDRIGYWWAGSRTETTRSSAASR